MHVIALGHRSVAKTHPLVLIHCLCKHRDELNVRKEGDSKVYSSPSNMEVSLWIGVQEKKCKIECACKLT